MDEVSKNGPALSQMRSDPQEQLAAGIVGVSDDPFACTWRCAHPVTLRHFDSKLGSMGQNGPIIPCERRLANMEIWENQELTFRGRFGNRDYGRPFRDILVTLCGFD